MDVSVFIHHLVISLMPWLIGVVLASGLGYVGAPAARGLFSRSPGWRRASLLLPWRTVAVSVPLVSPWVATLVGLGAVAAAIVVGLFVFLLALPVTVTVRLEKWYPSPPSVRFVAWIRTLAAASVTVAAVAAPMVGGGGAGSLILEGMRALNYAQMFRGFAVVIILALMIDLALGALQWLLSQDDRR
ncbi:MAG: hypothetical protein PVH80_09630 [Anaerolineae bacterium]|jgi:hypothetical protein